MSDNTKDFPGGSLMIPHGIKKHLGDLATSVVLAALMEHHRKLDHRNLLPQSGWFFFPRAWMEESTCLGDSTIRERLGRLKDLGLVETKKAGRPARQFYKLDWDRIHLLNSKGVQDTSERESLLVDESGLRPAGDGGQRPAGDGGYSKRGRSSKSEFPSPSEKSGDGMPSPRPKLPLIEPEEGESSEKQRPRLGSHPSFQPRKETPTPVRIPKELQPIVEKWRAIAVNHGPTTKALREGVESLKAVRAGKHFGAVPAYRNQARAYTVNEIMRALERFDLKRNSPDYMPRSKKSLRSLSLSEFIYSPHLRNGNGAGGASLFLECLREAPRLAVDADPDLTECVRRLIRDARGEAVEYEVGARIAQRLSAMYAAEGDWLRKHGMRSVKVLAATALDAFEEERGSNFNLAGLMSAEALEAVVKPYLRSTRE